MTIIVPSERESAQEFPTWKRINLGTYKSAQDLLDAFRKSGLVVSHWAIEVLQKTDLAKAQLGIDLVNVAASDLGFTSGVVRRAVIYDRAKQLGLEPSQAEVGPQLCIQYPDQPQGDPLIIGMEPISDSCDIPLIFNIGYRDGRRCLFCGGGKPNDLWATDRRWIFRKATSR